MSKFFNVINRVYIFTYGVGIGGVSGHSTTKSTEFYRKHNSYDYNQARENAGYLLGSTMMVYGGLYGAITANPFILFTGITIHLGTFFANKF
jgi:hypothetical protein